MENKFKNIAIIVLSMVLVIIIATNKEYLAGIIEILDGEFSNTEGDTIEVHFIDVGQGDSILIKEGNKSMLIDGGDNQYGEKIITYLKDNNIYTLDYIIGTHPHADHIGGLDDVVNNFNVEKILMPKVSHNTKTFEDLLLAIRDKGLKVTTPIVGDRYKLNNAEFTIIAPNKEEYSNLNNYSIGIKLKFYNNSFVLTGDGELEAEKEMLDSGLNIRANVLKAGHHGSNTSTTVDFLDKVNPDYVVIQVGENNKYNHPDKEIIERLEERDIKVYRNDLDGDIIFIGDGKDLKIKTNKTLNIE